ncbi:glycosyltransferase family 39 protein [bacterium]|nr:glycosyltransferase family 39 protein [bacterium]
MAGKTMRKKKISQQKRGQRKNIVATAGAPKIFQWLELYKPGFVGMAVILAWLGQNQFAARHLSLGLLFWVLAAVFAVIAFWKQSDHRSSEIDQDSKFEAMALGLIVVVAIVVRVWRLAEIPHGFHFDEAVNALIALQIIQEPGYLPIFGPSDAPLPTLFHYFNVVALVFIGVSATAVKFVPVFAGTATVIMFYFLARRMVSRPVALAGALLFALLRWHINFSRINFVGILTPLFGVAAAYFLIRGMETKNRWHMAFSGLSVALGLYTYYASNLVPFVLGPYMVLQLAWDRKFLKEQWQGLLAFLVVSLAVFIPLGHFALTEKHRFFSRNGQVIIFSHVPPEQALEALWRNIKTTLLMFHYFGDCNGRHNLPEAPMLSPIAGLLFGFGLIWSFMRLHRRHTFLAVWWFLVALVPGFLTIEAPQSYRCIGAIVPVMLIMTFGLERLWQAVRELTEGMRIRPWLWVGLVLLVAVIGSRNLYDYFVRQAGHVASWSEFSSQQHAIGSRIHALGSDYHTYISAGSYYYPTIRFMGYPHHDTEPFDMIQSIPSDYQKEKNLSYMLLPIHDGALELLRYYYPDGKETIHHSPYDFSLFTSYEVLQAEIQASRGLLASYQDSRGRVITEHAGKQGFSINLAIHELAAPIRVSWTGSIRAPAWETYQFRLQGEERAVIRIEDRVVSGKGVELAQGMHRISVQARLRDSRKTVTLQWKRGTTGPWNTVPGHVLSPRIQVHGLVGTYYRATDWSGRPTFCRVDPLISMLGHDFTMASPFSVRWAGTILIPETGRYTFGTLSNERSWVFIDGQAVVANDKVDREAQGSTRLSKGKHSIRIDYQKTEGAYPRIVFYWTPPGKPKEKVPFTVLSVEQGR